MQYGTFLNGILSIDDYVLRLPPIESLLTEYHLRTDVAFFLSRPKINFTIQVFEQEIKSLYRGRYLYFKSGTIVLLVQNCFQAKFDESRKADPNSKKWSDAEKLQKYFSAVVKVTTPIVESIHPLYPSKVWDDMSPKFVILFWSLTLYDLEVPMASYQREIGKLRNVNEDLRNSKELVMNNF